jgi:hypothetical protein
MTTKDTMTQTQTLALAYAEKLVEYYRAKNTDGIDSDTLVRKAYNALCDAQNMLAYAAECEAD